MHLCVDPRHRLALSSEYCCLLCLSNLFSHLWHLFFIMLLPMPHLFSSLWWLPLSDLLPCEPSSQESSSWQPGVPKWYVAVGFSRSSLDSGGSLPSNQPKDSLEVIIFGGTRGAKKHILIRYVLIFLSFFSFSEATFLFLGHRVHNFALKICVWQWN